MLDNKNFRRRLVRKDDLLIYAQMLENVTSAPTRRSVEKFLMLILMNLQPTCKMRTWVHLNSIMKQRDSKKKDMINFRCLKSKTQTDSIPHQSVKKWQLVHLLVPSNKSGQCQSQPLQYLLNLLLHCQLINLIQRFQLINHMLQCQLNLVPQ